MPQDEGQDNAQQSQLPGQEPQELQVPQTPQQPQANEPPQQTTPFPMQGADYPTLNPQPEANTQTPPTQAPPSPVMYPKSTAKIFFTAVLILFFISIVAFGSAITAGYYNYPLITPPKPIKNTIDKAITLSPLPKPKRLIVDSAFAKTSSIKSADIKTELLMTTNSKNSPIELFKLTVEGPLNFKNPNSGKTEFDIGLEVGFEGANFNGAASVKTLENRIFFKVNEIPFGTMYRELLDYKNKWYYWDIPDRYRQKDKDTQVNENINTLIASFVQDSQAWTAVTSKEGQFYTLELNPPPDAITSLVYDIIKAYEPVDQEQLLDDLEKEKIADALKKLNKVKITMKIDKGTYYLSSMNAQFELALNNNLIPANTESLLPQDQTILNFNITASLSNYNKQILIIPPEGATNVEEAIGKFGENFPQDFSPPSVNLPPTLQLEELPNEPAVPPEGSSSPTIEDKESLRQLIAPEETILGEKYSWEKELFKLFAQILK